MSFRRMKLNSKERYVLDLADTINTCLKINKTIGDAELCKQLLDLSSLVNKYMVTPESNTKPIILKNIKVAERQLKSAYKCIKRRRLCGGHSFGLRQDWIGCNCKQLPKSKTNKQVERDECDNCCCKAKESFLSVAQQIIENETNEVE